jgi:FixJ family two-component response regulator
MMSPGDRSCDNPRVMAEKEIVSVVEDDESLRIALVGLLKSFGYAARSYASAEDYLGVRDGRCACLITDIQLPGITGFELIARLGELGYRVPVILITARHDVLVERDAAEHGVLCLLRKPFDARTLVDCVERALAA